MAPPQTLPLELTSNPTNPYYVPPSDVPSSDKVTPVFERSNYHYLSRLMRRALGGKLKLDFIDGSIQVPTYDFDPPFGTWNGCNMLVNSWFLNSVSEPISQSTVFMKNAIELQQEVYALKQDSKGLTEFYTTLKIL